MIGIEQLKRLLPHRYPMLLVDRVIELDPGRRIVAEHAVSGNEVWFREVATTEDPHAYGYPWVLVLESWAQAAGVLVTRDRPNPDVQTGEVMLFGAMAGVEVSDVPALPGDVLRHEVRLLGALSDTVIFEGESRVGARVVLVVERAVMALRPAEVLQARNEPAALGAGG